MTVHRERDGTLLLIDDADPNRTMVLDVSFKDDALTAAIAAFFGPDMYMPDEIPMHALRMFLIATGRKAQVQNFLNSLPEPQKSLALEEWEYAPGFVTSSALGQAAKAALGFDDAQYAEAMRDAQAFKIEDYGNPKPSLLAEITKFLLA